MNAYQLKIYNENVDIVDWLTCQLADSENDPEMLSLIIDKYYHEAVETFDKDESEFEEYAKRYITLRISKYKQSGGESKFWSEKKMDFILAQEESED